MCVLFQLLYTDVVFIYIIFSSFLSTIPPYSHKNYLSSQKKSWSSSSPSSSSPSSSSLTHNYSSSFPSALRSQKEFVKDPLNAPLPTNVVVNRLLSKTAIINNTK
jgi:hypothetical protein